MDLKPGIYPFIPIEQYVDDTVCEVPTLSSSMASTMLERSPAHAWHAHPRFNRKERDFSRAANFGTAVHSLVFGGESLVRIDADGYTTKAAREARDYALTHGQVPVLNEEFERAVAIADHTKGLLKDLCTETMDYENTIIFTVGKTLCRSRPDAISDSRRLIVDLKITGTNSREANRQFFSQGYDLQAAFLERAADSLDPAGVGKREIVYLFVEDEPPYAHCFLQVSEGTLSIARKKMNAAVNMWAKCLKDNQWPIIQPANTFTQRPSYEETAWLVREETDQMINVEAPK